MEYCSNLYLKYILRSPKGTLSGNKVLEPFNLLCCSWQVLPFELKCTQIVLFPTIDYIDIGLIQGYESWLGKVISHILARLWWILFLSKRNSTSLFKVPFFFTLPSIHYSTSVLSNITSSISVIQIHAKNPPTLALLYLYTSSLDLRT